jgi:hypothetical protein
MRDFTVDRDLRDVLGGLLLGALGTFMVVYASKSLQLGTFSNMQPGMFPTILGGLLIGLGCLIAAPAGARLVHGAPSSQRPVERVAWRPLFAVAGSIVAFAVCVTRVGVVPAIFVLTAVSVLADGKLGPRGALALAMGMAALIVLIFHYGLRLAIPLFIWPF